MIAQKTDVNAAELDGSTAMHWAAHLNDAASMDLLLNAGANPRAVTRNGATPFSLACYVGNAAAIERLLAAGEDANAVFSGEPALMMVARAGSADGVRALLARGANPNVAEPTRGQTALMWAAAGRACIRPGGADRVWRRRPREIQRAREHASAGRQDSARQRSARPARASRSHLQHEQ